MKQKGFHADRLKPKSLNPREFAFARKWEEEHDLKACRTILDHLVPCVTERDRQVAATVIQWLGSNVGMSFLEEVIKSSPDIQRYLAMHAESRASRRHGSETAEHRGNLLNAVGF